MLSREEKNKIYVDEIKKEETIKISKRILKVFGIILLVFSLSFLYIYFIGPKGMETHEYIIKDSDIPNSFHGIKVLHFTDLLYGKVVDNSFLDNLEKEIKLINPDIIIFTGNIFNKDYQIEEFDIKRINELFKNIPYTIGKYAVRGDSDNHSFDLVLEDTDFTILDNEIIEIHNNSTDKINIIGINEKEVKELKNSENFTITLINNYDSYEKYQIESNLVFAGHNLGGEIRLFNNPLLGNDKYQNNYYENNSTKIFISNGLGTLHHMRLMNKPSINVYRLVNK